MIYNENMYSCNNAWYSSNGLNMPITVVACVAMLAGCSYQHAFEAFGFVEIQFYTRHHHLISALEKLGCAVKWKRFCSRRVIRGHAIVAVNHMQYRYWHWVAFVGEEILDLKPGRSGRKMDLRGCEVREYLFGRGSNQGNTNRPKNGLLSDTVAPYFESWCQACVHQYIRHQICLNLKERIWLFWRCPAMRRSAT